MSSDYRAYLAALGLSSAMALERASGGCTDTDDIPLDVNAALSCGLIVNEPISTSLKHAFADRRQGRVMVTLRSAWTDVVLEVADNGVGLPASLDSRSPTDLTPDGGTRFGLRFTPGPLS